jgi:hypothetical protein
MAKRTFCTLSGFAVLMVSSLLSAEPKIEPRNSVIKPNEAFVPQNACRFSGVTTPSLDVPLFDHQGSAVARFGGVPVELIASDWPKQASGLLHVTTSGDGHLSLDGYIDVKAVPLFLRDDVPIVEGHVIVSRGTRVQFASAEGETLRVAINLDAPLKDTFTVSLPCQTLTIEAPKTEPWKMPSRARGYVMKVPSAPLFDAPGAGALPVMTVHVSPEAHGVLFFGDRREGDFIHVLYRRDVKFDGWMSVKDLELLPKGELVDQTNLRPSETHESRLRVASDARLLRAKSEIPLYGKADPKRPPIGTVPQDTELYVLDVVVGWANVLPKHLDVVPLTDRRFWVRANALGD